MKHSHMIRRVRPARHFVVLALLLTAFGPRPASGQKLLTGRFGLEVRGFAESPEFNRQARHGVSAFLEPELFVDWADGDHRIVVSPFARLDAADSRRTHVDLREAYWQWFSRSLEIRAGFARVFWGVTESQHLVDIINQTDGIEGPDGETKLGQPMVQLTWVKEFGSVDVFVMPFFRERTFPGIKGRLRGPAPVDADGGIRGDRVDLAFRYSHYVRALDFGISGFWGTSREPLLSFDGSRGILTATYPTIGQLGLDAQWTGGAWLAKLEAIYRTGYGHDFAALVSGIEYTFGNVRDSGVDVGLLAEVHLDGRSKLALGNQLFRTTPFNDDVFTGIRLALNDVQSTSVLTGAIVDRSSGETSLFLEASRRLGTRFTADLEIRSFHHTDSSSPLHGLRNDSYAQLRISYFF